MNTGPLVLPFSDVGRQDVGRVGGKNASLGEMINRLSDAGIAVPGGFATTAAAYQAFIKANRLEPKLRKRLADLRSDLSNVASIGKSIRKLILGAELPSELRHAIVQAYRGLVGPQGGECSVAVRSSATAEDLPEASFAGQLESFLNVVGETSLLDACRRCFASLFTNRAIVYRENHGFDHMAISLSVGIQRMVRSDLAGSGVMFSIDTETGFPRAVIINAGWGLGETVVQGIIDPDEYHVFKPLLGRADVRPIIYKTIGSKQKKLIYGDDNSGEASKLIQTSTDESAHYVLDDEEILKLAQWAVTIENHYGQPIDMEWAKDGETGGLYMVQARPETVQSRISAGRLQSFHLKERGERLLSGLAIGSAIAAGKVCRLKSPTEIERFVEGSVLVTSMTDPDWVPIMKRAAAIVTDHGGRTSHAAIVSRELGLPAIVGAGNATAKLKQGRSITVSCAEGDVGHVYDGIADFEIHETDIDSIPKTQTKVMINLANPAAAFRWWRLPSDGVGLARMEFIIGNLIKIHPMALVHFDRVADAKSRRTIEGATRGYADMREFFVERLAYGIARIAAAHFPNPVIVRMSDFKTNEYARLVGGEAFEPHEENPMLGWRGASRYYSEGYREGFALECQAMSRAREKIGMTNVVMMIPFCRTPEEADRVLAVLADNGLVRGRNGLEIYVMAEIPANVILADRFAERFDGFSIGSNDLTQLVLGVDRDSEALHMLFDERHEAVKRAITALLQSARRTGTHTGICGQAPSDHPEFARFLVEQGIASISVSPDSFFKVKEHVAAAEIKAGSKAAE